MTEQDVSADARLAHAGGRRDLGAPVVQPPVLATIFGSAGEPQSADYGRGGNPTWAALEDALGSATALAIAEHLGAHPAVTAVHYPGVHEPTLALARAQMPRGFGPLLSFEVAGTAADADAVVAAARLIGPATSFGGVESTWERRGRWAGESAPAALVRLSVGIEPAPDLIADIDNALAAVPLVG